MKITLYINTADKNQIVVELKGSVVDKLTSEQQFGSQVLLNLIDQILVKNNLASKDLSEIEVNTGPGSYTGIKVGVSVANAFAFGLGIPVNNKQQETELVYT